MKNTKKGDKKSFEKLVLKYRKSAVGFSYSMIKDIHMSEDIVQESFAAIYIKRKSYKLKNSFKSFLFKIIKNRCIDYIRKNNKSSVSSYEQMDLISEEFSPYEVLEHSQKLTYAGKILNKLKLEYRNAVFLYEYYGFSYREIAEIMDKSLPQVKIIIYRARNKIRKYVEEDMQNDK